MQKEKIIQIVESEFELFNESIRETLKAEKINATGEASKSLRVESDNNSVKSLGVFYLEFLDTGRGHGKYPPLDKILDWVKVKFPEKNEDEAEIFAKIVQQRIAKLGTLIFQNNGVGGIRLSEKKELVRQNLSIALKKEVKEQLTQRLDKFKKLYKTK
jgi:hypothetical protein